MQKRKKKSNDTDITATSKKNRTNLRHLPLWNIILHKDDNDQIDNDQIDKRKNAICEIIYHEISKLPKEHVNKTVNEAFEKGQSILLTAHLEYAELVIEVLKSHLLNVSLQKA